MKAQTYSRLVNRITRAMGSPLARIVGLCCRTELRSIGLSLVPGFLTFNIGFRAGGSGQAHQSYMSNQALHLTALQPRLIWRLQVGSLSKYSLRTLRLRQPQR